MLVVSRQPYLSRLLFVSFRFYFHIRELFRLPGVKLAVGTSVPDGRKAVYSDEDLVADVLNGDNRSFDALVLRYQDRAYRFCLRYMGNANLAEEVAQDVFVRVYKNLKSFRGDAKFSTWFYQVMGNHCKNQVGRAIRRKERFHVSIHAVGEAGDGPAFELQDPKSSPEVQVEQGERLAYLSEALASLAPEERRILILREVEGQSYEEISEVIGLALGTVKSRIFRARRVLKQRIETLMGGEL